MKRLVLSMLVAVMMLSAAQAAEPASKPASAPFQPPKYIWATAYHILPETHNNESGYFSLCEGKNGKIYVGTAKYGVNAYLVEFDPKTEKQRIVVDVNKVCGLTATGYAAQAKIHTRNFVGPSGKIYIGSKQGYPKAEDLKNNVQYLGGYVMVYDPATDKTENLGMPYNGQGVADVTADEGRGLIYVVTCEDQHWMLYDVKTKKYRELGPLLAPYMTTLVDSRGRANAITKDFRMATYDPATDKVTVRDIVVDGKKLTADDLKTGPITWDITADANTAYLIRMTEPALFSIDLAGEGSTVSAVKLGNVMDGSSRYDSRGSLTIAPDGRVYLVERVDHEKRFGLHHLVRYDPKSRKMEDLGALAVKNPDFYGLPLDSGGAIDPATKKPRPWTNCFRKLPDGTLVPWHVHLAARVAGDGEVYVTIISPFTLLRIPAIP